MVHKNTQLIQLLKYVNLPNDMAVYFNDGVLKNLNIKREEMIWTFNIILENVLPLNVYLEFSDLLEKTFLNDDVIREIGLVIETKNSNYQNKVEEYFSYIISFLSMSSPMLQTIRQRDIKFENGELAVQSYSKVESNKFARYAKHMEQMYAHCGFRDLKVVFRVCENPTKLEETIKAKQKEVEHITSQIKAVDDNPTPPTQRNVSSRNKVKEMSSKDETVILGYKIDKPPVPIKTVTEAMPSCIIKGEIVDISYRDTKNSSKLFTIKVTDFTDTIACKFFIRDNSDYLDKVQGLNEGDWIILKGVVQYDKFDRCDTVKTFDINKVDFKETLDTAEESRVELHAHTKFSLCDSVAEPSELIKYAAKNGHKAVAITDHNVVQAFPNAYYASKKHGIKVLYGVELNMVDDVKSLVFNGTKETSFVDETFVVFDFETTGFNAGAGDTIIEFGAVKLKGGVILDKFSQLVKTDKPLNEKIVELTGIRDKDLKDAPAESEVIVKFKEWIGDHTLVAHNASFDYSFLKASYERNNIGDINNVVIDTLELSRNLHPEFKRHGLGSLVKKYDIKLENHHRAVHDAEATAQIFVKQLKRLEEMYRIERICDIPNFIKKEDIHKTGAINHLTILAKNNDGLKSLFELISLANTKYFHKVPRILRSEIISRRENLLIGSSCADGEIFKEARRSGDDSLRKLIQFYDYIEVQPLDIYSYLVDKGEFEHIHNIKENIIRIVSLGRESGKLVCASGDVHHIRERDKILREIVVATPVVGGGRHHLSHHSIKEVPSHHYRLTDEMLNDFEFLGGNIAKEIVIDNPSKIADMIEDVQIIKDDLYTPKIEGVNETVTNMVFDKAKSIYGDDLPEIVQSRLEKELNSIIGNGFAVIYLISHQLVKKSLEDGYLVGSRGSVGSSLVATMMDITEVNPLAPHYVCPECKYNEFISDSNIGSGYDLKEKACPKCSTDMIRDGHEIPFETFLGFKGDKVPDIDLNFSGYYQPRAHEYTKVLLGEDNVYRAGTIGTIAEKTAYGYVKGFEGDNNLNFRPAEIDRLVKGIVGVKRNTGQHPGGIIVIPDHLDVHDFTPVQYPADDVTSNWKTTHFDFHAIHDNILKLDILGHDDPTVIRMLQDITGIDPKTINPGASEVVSLYRSSGELGLEPLELNATTTMRDKKGERVSVPYKMFTTGTLGMPESGTRIVIAMFDEIQPKTFADLVKISGLSHGTDVWSNNARDLVNGITSFGKIPFEEVIGCRDDIMVYLIHKGLEASLAFRIMESVRRGKGLTDEWEAAMKENNVPDWYIDSCKKIKYMFPKAHATAYVLMAMRIGFFKINYPLHFYATYFTVRASNYDLDTMIAGYDAIKLKLEEIINKGFDATAKETSVAQVLELALEMTARGYEFANVSLEKSKATEFIIEGNTLIPPFSAVDGLGVKVAEQIVIAREESNFLSKEDFLTRGKVNKTLKIKLELMGVLDGLPETDQLSLF